MDIEADGRGSGFGNKRLHQRMGPTPSSSSSSSSNKVCHYWRAGNCNRFPCPYLHSELPEAGGTHQGSGGLVWRNPNGGGGGRTGASSGKWGNRGGGRGGGGGNKATPTKPCKFFMEGSCHYGDKCRYLHAWHIGDDFAPLTPLQGHQKVITGIALPSGSDKLYSGSNDATVRVWDCQTGQCAGAVEMGREVGCMISEGPWLFVGILNTVKVWNTQTGTELSLSGPTGQVYALVVGNDMLFAGTQDGRILAWKFSAAGNCFEPAASLDGHRLAVISFVVGANRLYSGSMDKTIRIWDLTTLQCIQTLSDHTDVVMSVLCWDQYLLSSSLDQTVKVWAATDTGSLALFYNHKEEHGVLSLCGMHDAQGKPVLLCSLNDNTVRLYELPTFLEKGRIFAKQEVRAIQVGPGGIFFTGDGTGELKVWKWSEERLVST